MQTIKDQLEAKDAEDIYINYKKALSETAKMRQKLLLQAMVIDGASEAAVTDKPELLKDGIINAIRFMRETLENIEKEL